MTDDEFSEWAYDQARKYVELDRRIRRRIDPDLPKHRSKQWQNPDAGVHDDAIQRAFEKLWEKKDKLIKGGMKAAHAKSFLRSIPADHTYRTSGWQLSEHDSKALHDARAWADAIATREQGIDPGQLLSLARDRYLERGGSRLVFDRIYGEPLSLFGGEDYDDYSLIDLVPDESPGPEELVTEAGEPHPIERSIADFIAEELDEAEQDFLDLLKTRKQSDVAQTLHISEGRVSQRKTALREKYLSWKTAMAAAPAEVDDEQESA